MQNAAALRNTGPGLSQGSACTICGGPDAICDARGNAGRTHCRECSRPEPGKCTACGGPVPSVWQGPTRERPFDPSVIPFRWLPGDDLCPACVAAKAQSAQENELIRLKQASGLPDDATGWDFGAAQAGAKALLGPDDFGLWWDGFKLVRYWNTRDRWPYLYGPARRGKTVLLYCLVQECLSQHKEAFFLDGAYLVGLLGQRNQGKTERLMARAKEARFLALDDLGVLPLKRKRQRAGLYEILDWRLKQKLPTAISSNLDYGDLEKQIPKDMGRIVGRVMDMTLPVRMRGPNLSMAKAGRGA